MDQEYEKEYLHIELHNPWYIQRRELIYSLMKHIPRNAKILDYGSGAGQWLSYLSEKGYKNVTGFEPSEYFNKAKKKGITIIKSRKALKKETYDVVFLLDVLEHIKEDKKAFNEVASLVKQGGTMVVSVPTYNFLWSVHDVMNKHLRRYSAAMLEAIKPANLTIKRRTFWNFFLFAPTALLKILKRNQKQSKTNSDFSSMASSRLTLFVFNACLKIENILVRCGINFPFGTSVFYVFEKQKKI